VIPILNKAVTGLQQLNRTDLDELRSLKKPPDAIKVLLQAVCIILKEPPILVQVPSENPKQLKKYEKDYWQPSIGPNVLGSKNIT
jgi:dynein heavy chain